MPKVRKKNPLQMKLIMAATNNEIEKTEELLNEGADPNQSLSKNNTLLHLTVRYGCLQIVRLLLRHGAKESINKQNYLGRTPLHEVLTALNTMLNNDIDRFNNYKGIIRLLLQYNANMFIRNNSAQTPLTLVSRSNYVDIRMLFLERFQEGLIIAVLKNDIDATKFLLNAGINPNQKDNTTGFMLLHFAARCGFLGIADLLLQHGADVHKVNEFGFTALHYVADNNHIDLAKLLLKYGASKSKKDNYNKIPQQWAIEKNYLALANLLSIAPLQTRQGFFHNLPREFENKNKPLSGINNDEPLDLSMKSSYRLSY